MLRAIGAIAFFWGSLDKYASSGGGEAAMTLGALLLLYDLGGISLGASLDARPAARDWLDERRAATTLALRARVTRLIGKAENALRGQPLRTHSSR